MPEIGANVKFTDSFTGTNGNSGQRPLLNMKSIALSFRNRHRRFEFYVCPTVLKQLVSGIY
jgi:hypothetical protein